MHNPEAVIPQSIPQSIPFPTNIPFMTHLGVQLTRMQDGESQLELLVEPWHCNSWEFNHGGVTMTLLDVAMSMAGRTLFPNDHNGMTVEMKTTFVQTGGRSGERIIARGKAYHRTSTLCFCDAEIWMNDRLVAKSSGTFRFAPRLVSKKAAS